MAESVDALVSNTSGATRAGSTPALGTEDYQSTKGVWAITALHTFFSFLALTSHKLLPTWQQN